VRLCGPSRMRRAEIAVGRVGREQSATRKEFDGDASQPRRRRRDDTYDGPRLWP
jgi:hypothetical protein